jgi:hypothetical protein
MVQCSNWTRDMETFLEWLIAFSFDGGGFDDAAIAEGLADALAVCLYVSPAYYCYPYKCKMQPSIYIMH